MPINPRDCGDIITNPCSVFRVDLLSLPPLNSRMGILAALFIALLAWMDIVIADGCLFCHPVQGGVFAPGHDFGSHSCTPCHRGDGRAENETDAHLELIAFPGNLASATESCSSCHSQQVTAVQSSFMATGKGIVDITRRVFGEQSKDQNDFSSLGHSPADSLLRKLCASCHLGHRKTARRLDSPRRGGGCLACHLNAYPKGSHPRLTIRIDDQRCLGCHSRSGRVSLNYIGLAEVEAVAWQRPGVSDLLHLDDGRLMQRKEPDLHHRAGMACIDCHTGQGLMGSAERLHYAREAVDIQCTDCHRNNQARVQFKDWPQTYTSYAIRLPFTAEPDQPFLTTERKGTILWNVEVDGEQLWLHRKLSNGRIKIPQYASTHLLTEEHARLSCDACHSRWAPQCYGCHIEFDPDSRQWDHQLQQPTRGRWREHRWGVESNEPALGMTAEGRIHPFVPGMILSIEHPQWERPRFHRLFAALSPHTTGKARDCTSCHRSSRTLGLGEGQLLHCEDGWRFIPKRPALQDGLPADAWTALSRESAGTSIRKGDRSLLKEEILRILRAKLMPVTLQDKTAPSLDAIECGKLPRTP